MSAGLRHSTIETFRKRNHADCVLKLLKLSSDGQELNLVRQLTQGFFLCVAPEGGEGKSTHQIVIDKVYTPLLTVTELASFSMVDLLNTVTNEVKRYHVDTDNRPIVNDWRYVYGSWAALNDVRPIV